MNGLVLCHTVVLLVDHGCGDGAHEDHNPDDQAKDLGHFGAPQMPPAERVDNGNVAVQVDAHEEEAATIHVYLEDRSRDLAQKVIKGPVVVGIVVESQWQRKCEDEVTHGQVEHVDHHHRLQAQVVHEDPEGHHIEHQTHNEDQDVARQKEVVAEVVILARLRHIGS
uniref:Secreted protein n=1 Tax=Apteryx owenii TaxID=8824 RepID=A0A8B9PRW0_APTOW